jgi:hypothetical protein
MRSPCRRKAIIAHHITSMPGEGGAGTDAAGCGSAAPSRAGLPELEGRASWHVTSGITLPELGLVAASKSNVITSPRGGTPTLSALPEGLRRQLHHRCRWCLAAEGARRNRPPRRVCVHAPPAALRPVPARAFPRSQRRRKRPTCRRRVRRCAAFLRGPSGKSSAAVAETLGAPQNAATSGEAALRDRPGSADMPPLLAIVLRTEARQFRIATALPPLLQRSLTCSRRTGEVKLSPRGNAHLAETSMMSARGRTCS